MYILRWHHARLGNAVVLAAAPGAQRELKQLLNVYFRSKVRRGMRVRVVSDQQVVIEDIDEWLSQDMFAVRSRFKHPLFFDVYATSCQQTSISGMCVCLTIQPLSVAWTLFAYALGVLSCTVFIAWACVLHEEGMLDVWGI